MTWTPRWWRACGSAPASERGCRVLRAVESVAEGARAVKGWRDGGLIEPRPYVPAPRKENVELRVYTRF